MNVLAVETISSPSEMHACMYILCTLYIGENRFESLEDLVQDGLITLYLQRHNVAQTMHEGQMQSMLRRKVAEKKLRLLKRTHGK